MRGRSSAPDAVWSGVMSSKKRWFSDAYSIKNRRSSNMDCVLVKEGRIGGVPAVFAAVCDGVGSLRDGGEASSLAVRLLSRWFDGLEDVRRLGLNLLEAIISINQSVIGEAAARGLNTASTVSAIIVAEDRYYIVHLGDSRIYAFDGAGLRQMTVDQTEGGKLTSYIGRKPDVRPFYDEGEVGGMSFMLCSDGLYRCLDVETILAELRRARRHTIRKTIKRLLKLAVERGENDNISMAILLQK